MGTYIVRTNQYAHKDPDQLDDGQAFHRVLEYGDEVELDDDHHHTKTLITRGAVISKQAAEKQQEAADSAGQLDSAVGGDQAAESAKTDGAATKSTNAPSGPGGSQSKG
jgi:hypothetical protein